MKYLRDNKFQSSLSVVVGDTLIYDMHVEMICGRWAAARDADPG